MRQTMARVKINGSANHWIRRRFLELRLGHSNYTLYLLALTNFLIISYTLLLAEIPVARQIIPNIGVYAVFFMVVYPSIAIVLGYWHRKTQYPIDLGLEILNNPLLRDLWVEVLASLPPGPDKERRARILRELGQ